MEQNFNNDAVFDPSNRAEGVLDFVLDETSEETQAKKTNEADVADELRRTQLLEQESKRVHSRILFITRDKRVLEESTQEQEYFKNLSEVFDEVHVLVLGLKKRPTESIRIAQKVWAYPVVSRYMLQLPFSAVHTAKAQLLFTDGFRPDLIVALDAFESGAAGYLIARKYERALQVHIDEDFTREEFQTADPLNKWRLRFAHFVCARISSVRVHTDVLRKVIAEQYPKIKDISLLPRYFNIQESLKYTPPATSGKLFPQFSFVILYVGELGVDSTLYRALDAVRALMRTKTVGMVVIGDGVSRGGFQERAEILGISDQVIFKKKVDDVLHHMHSADVLICTDTTSESESVVVKSAASGLPMILAKTTLRSDLFEDSEDAFLCTPDDVQEFSEKLIKFINTNAKRTQFAENARDVIQTRIEEDPVTYRMAIRDSIESVLYMKEREEQETEQAKQDKENIVEQREKEVIQKEEQKLKKKISEEGLEMKLPTR